MCAGQASGDHSPEVGPPLSSHHTLDRSPQQTRGSKLELTKLLSLQMQAQHRMRQDTKPSDRSLPFLLSPHDEIRVLCHSFSIQCSLKIGPYGFKR